MFSQPYRSKYIFLYINKNNIESLKLPGRGFSENFSTKARLHNFNGSKILTFLSLKLVVLKKNSFEEEGSAISSGINENKIVLQKLFEHPSD